MSKHLLFENSAFLSFSQKKRCRKKKERIHKKFPISECPAIFHSCVVVVVCFLPPFLFGWSHGRRWYCAGHNLNLEIKGHWKRETDKNEVAIKVLSSITRKAVRELLLEMAFYSVVVTQKGLSFPNGHYFNV